MRTLVKLASFACLALTSQIAAANLICDQLKKPTLVNYPNSIYPLKPIAPRLAIVELFHPGLLDYFYTTNELACNEAIYFKGYLPMGTTAYADRRSDLVGTVFNPVGTVFRGFWKGPPQTDHFYSSFQPDITYVEANGWVELPANQRIFLPASTAPDVMALHRVHYFDHLSWELAHFYTLSMPHVRYKESMGWIYDTIAGHAYTQATPPVKTDSTGTSVTMGRRCEYLPGAQAGNCFSAHHWSNYRDFQFNQFALVSNQPKPTGQSVQTMSFTFSHSKYFIGSLHLAAALRANSNIYLNQIRNSTLYGLGLAIGNTTVLGPCGIDGMSIFVEAFWPMGNKIKPEGCLNTGPLNEGQNYSVTLQVDDGGNVSFSLRNASSNVLIASRQLNATSWFPPEYPFPAAKGGHMLIDSGSPTGGDYDVRISNFKTSWSSPGGVARN